MTRHATYMICLSSKTVLRKLIIGQFHSDTDIVKIKKKKKRKKEREILHTECVKIKKTDFLRVGFRIIIFIYLFICERVSHVNSSGPRCLAT